MPTDNSSKLAALNAIKSKFTSTVIKVWINSLEREVCFREITVAEQKKLARIMIDNENRKDIVYDAQCAILKQICLDDSVDMYKLLEFDKIKLLLMLYQRNMVKHEISFTCPECHTENKYQIDFANTIQKLDKFDVSDREYEYENASWKFKFKLGYPTVDKVSKFYSSRYAAVRKSHDRASLESFNTSVNVDYVNLFIKEIEFADVSQPDQVTKVVAGEYTTEELMDVVSVFPQDVLYSEKGIIQHITSEFITKINDMFDKHQCYVCGKLCDDAVDQDMNGFF